MTPKTSLNGLGLGFLGLVVADSTRACKERKKNLHEEERRV